VIPAATAAAAAVGLEPAAQTPLVLLLLHYSLFHLIYFHLQLLLLLLLLRLLLLPKK
jgi:hypothetical protein